MQLLQETHTVLRTPNLRRRNTTPIRKTRKYNKNASTKKPKRSKTIPWTCRLLQKICPQIHRHFKSSDTSNKEGHRIQMGPRMQKLFLDSKGILTTSTNTQIFRPPGKLHPVHRCFQIRIRRRINPTN